MPPPPIWTRREFLRRSAAAGVLAAGAGLAAACDGGAPGSNQAEPAARTGASLLATTAVSSATTTDAATTAPATVPPDPLADVVAVAVHPAIGIARVGNSVDSFFLAPEVPDSVPVAPDGFKDAHGAIARQAARFRIYGYDSTGAVVGEITSADAVVTWSVSVANAKAAWYDFDTAMDLSTAGAAPRRNAAVFGADRDRLVIASGERSIAGPAAAPVPLGGAFLGEPVPLGELLTDEHGRLVFLPGPGRGYSPGQAPLPSFANNDGWADDTCDGPVWATVTLGQRTFAAAPGWVVVAPPNYGPAVRAGLITGYDAARLGWEHPGPGAPVAEPVSFRGDIAPILRRLVDLQWVNAGYLGANGWGSPGDFTAPELLDRLADPSPTEAALRGWIFAQFRRPDDPDGQPGAVPQVYGDGVAFPPESIHHLLAVTPIQHAHLAAWAAGTFVDDRDAPAVADIAELEPDAQVAALDRAGLDACLGGPFHPGIELPWTLRVPSMWSGPARLRVRATVVDRTDHGDVLTPERTFAADGPLAGSGPGDLTRWLGTPWHADVASCRSGHRPDISTVLPTFWPARVPNHVLRDDDYRIVVDPGRPLAERRAAFGRRYDWARFVTAATPADARRAMVDHWAELGVVTEQPGPGDGAFPSVMAVETGVAFTEEPPTMWSAAWEQTSPLVWDDGPATTPS